MATKVYIDRVTTLSCVERAGVVVELTREALVVGLTDGNLGVLDSALAELDKAGHKQGSIPGDYNNVVLVERRPSIVPGDPGKVEVELQYVHYAENEWQPIGQETWPLITVETAIEQITTPKAKPFELANDELLSVEHTYPDDHATQPGRTIVQGGEIQITVPRKRITLRGVLTTKSGDGSKYSALLNTVNDGEWIAGCAAGTLLCTKADYTVHDRVSSKCKFHYEFEYKEEGWPPIVAFVDPETGKIPPGLVKGTGWKTVNAYSLQDFGILGTPREE